MLEGLLFWNEEVQPLEFGITIRGVPHQYKKIQEVNCLINS